MCSNAIAENSSAFQMCNCATFRFMVNYVTIWLACLMTFILQGSLATRRPYYVSNYEFTETLLLSLTVEEFEKSV